MILFLIPESGYVAYKTVVRTLGLLSDEIKGLSRDIKGGFEYRDGVVKGALEIPAISFKSGNISRDRDVAKILKYKDYPNIKVKVLEIHGEDVKKISTQERGSIRARLEIFAAGRSKEYEVIARFSKIGEDKVNIKCEVDSKFTDFEIEPPTLGLFIKMAPDELKLLGDITFRIKKEG